MTATVERKSGLRWNEVDRQNEGHESGQCPCLYLGWTFPLEVLLMSLTF